MIAKTSKAILIRETGIDDDHVELDVNQWWVPNSVIEGSDLDDIGDTGCIEVEDWFAKKMEWDE